VKTIGERVKYYRKLRGLTQKELADILNYGHKSSIGKIEAGETEIPQARILAFSEALGITPNQLLGFENSDFMSFYDLVIDLCLQKGISISFLMDELGFSRSNPAQWRKGTVPTASKVKEIADYFNVPVSYFTEQHSNIRKPYYKKVIGTVDELDLLGTHSQENKKTTSPLIDEAVKILSSLSTMGQAQALVMLDELLKKEKQDYNNEKVKT